MNRLLFKVILIITVFLFACSKKKDGIAPTIDVHLPVYLQQINGEDTIRVSATITDNKNIESVSAVLINENNIPILATVTKRPEGLAYNLNVSYFFNNIHLPSGEYNMKISAFDGENTTDKYVTILFNELPKTKKGTFVISNSTSFSQVYFLDNNYNSSFYQSISGDYLGAAVNSYSQQLVYASSITGSVSATDLTFGGNLWNVPIVNSSSTPFYKGFYFYDQDVYLGKKTGGILSYNKFGSPNFHTPPITGYYMESGHIHNNQYFVAEEPQAATNLVNLSLYFMLSGGMHQQTAVNKDVVGIFTKNANTIILLVNDASNNGKVLFYDIPSGFLSSPFTINLNKIDACFEIGNGVYLTLEGGDLTIVNINNFSTLPYLNGVNADNIWLDKFTNELFVASGNSLTIYDYATKTVIGNYTHTDIIKDVVFWYNK